MHKLHFEREVLQKLTSGQENSDFAREVAISREKVAYRVDGTPTLESMVSRERCRKKLTSWVHVLSFKREGLTNVEFSGFLHSKHFIIYVFPALDYPNISTLVLKTLNSCM